MERLLDFIDKFGVRIVVVLLLVVIFRLCTINSKISDVEDKIVDIEVVVDSSMIQIKKEIKIEGLKSEKRMIQSTDRKLMDVNRQSEIDEELLINGY